MPRKKFNLDFQHNDGSTPDLRVTQRIVIKEMKNGIITVTPGSMIIDADYIDFGTSKARTGFRKRR